MEVRSEKGCKSTAKVAFRSWRKWGDWDNKGGKANKKDYTAAGVIDLVLNLKDLSLLKLERKHPNNTG